MMTHLYTDPPKPLNPSDTGQDNDPVEQTDHDNASEESAPPEQNNHEQKDNAPKPTNDNSDLNKDPVQINGTFTAVTMRDALGNPLPPNSQSISTNIMYPGKTLLDQFNRVAQSGDSRYVRPISDQEFIKYHLGISFDEWQRQQTLPRTHLRNKLGSDDPDQPGYLTLFENTNDDLLEITRIQNPSYKSFMSRLEKVGGEFGWSSRKKYQNVELIESILAKNDTAMLAFNLNGTEIGFTIVSGIQKTPPSQSTNNSLNKNEAIRRFSAFENDRIDAEKLDFKKLPQNPSVLEIYKFGMYQNNTSQSYGHYFLPAVLEMAFNGDLFPGQDGPQVVYLDTRDTNPIGTLKFYLRNGLSIFAEETLPNDVDLDNVALGNQHSNNTDPSPAAPDNNGPS